MNECDLEPEQALVGLLVDQLHTLLGKTLQLASKIAHLVGDVMHPRTAVRDELAHRSVVAESAEQLDPALAEANGRRLDSLRPHSLAMLQLGAEDGSIRLDGLVEVLDRHA